MCVGRLGCGPDADEPDGEDGGEDVGPRREWHIDEMVDSVWELIKWLAELRCGSGLLADLDIQVVQQRRGRNVSCK